jgi:hypothetical protein
MTTIDDGRTTPGKPPLPAKLLPLVPRARGSSSLVRLGPPRRLEPAAPSAFKHVSAGRPPRPWPALYLVPRAGPVPRA